jgi:hypothetical protein
VLSEGLDSPRDGLVTSGSPLEKLQVVGVFSAPAARVQAEAFMDASR